MAKQKKTQKATRKSQPTKSAVKTAKPATPVAVKPARVLPSARHIGQVFGSWKVLGVEAVKDAQGRHRVMADCVSTLDPKVTRRCVISSLTSSRAQEAAAAREPKPDVNPVPPAKAKKTAKKGSK